MNKKNDQSPGRTLNRRASRRNSKLQPTMNSINPNTSQIYLLLIYLYQVLGMLKGSTMIYSTLVAPLNPNLASWVKMALQGQALAMHTYMEIREVMFVISTPELLPCLGSESDGTIKQPLWISIVLQALMNFPVPTIPFFHIPTWETLTVHVTQIPQLQMIYFSPSHFQT